MIPLLLELQMTLSRNNAPDPWKCNTFGLQIRLHKRITLLIGSWEKKILWTDLLKITWLCITPKSDHTISIWITPQPISLDQMYQVSSQGVLELMPMGMITMPFTHTSNST